ncbi:ABC-three component system middle component 1 [Latilactobacillus sp. 5-91]|uniref:ABC-three component system middle component 1 n=1 Tax=Latilactobacillus sp. 5-91 TaxID=3410924 RepID=UPI003C74CBE7
MINYVKKNLGYLKYHKNEYDFYSKENDDYFKIDEYTEEELLNYFQTEVTKRSVENYKRMIEVKDSAKINSIQIILVKVDDFELFFNSNKNQIMKIEEDPYYFRKYVLVYTQTSLDQIREYTLSELKQFVLENDNYEKFEQDIFKMPEYFLAMECYIKFPFFNLPVREEKYLSLESLIIREVNEKKQNLVAERVNKIFEFIDDVHNSEDEIESLVDSETESKIINLLKEIY